MPKKKKEFWISIGGRTFPEKAFIPANACVVRERPKGHKQYYHYLYYRLGGRLRKRYVPEHEVDFTKKIIAEMRQRKKCIQSLADEVEKLAKPYL